MPDSVDRKKTAYRKTFKHGLRKLKKPKKNIY